MTTNANIDRRDLLKATGVAAGALALGASGRALASTSHSHIIAASDSHLGAPKANDSDFLEFVQDEVPAKDPDALILNGDILEFWTRGMTSACLDFNDFTTHLEDLDSQGIDVVLTAGNHDRRLIDVGRDDYDAATLDSPWSIANEFHFESGGTEFVAVHGDEGDPLQNPTTSELLCLGTDDFGKAIWDFYSAKDDIGSANEKYVGETGTYEVSANDKDWYDYDWETVSLQQTYNDPVVVAAPISHSDSTRAHARVRDVDSGEFDIQIEEWNYNSGGSVGPEDVGYIALNQGVHTLPDGTRLEAGTVATDENWASVSFTTDWDATPVVLTASQTDNGGDAVVTRHRKVDTEGFEVRLQEEEARGDHNNEKIGYIAIEPGTGKNNGEPFEAVRTANDVTDSWEKLSFENSFGSAPVFVASTRTFDGADPIGLRYQNLDAGSVEVKVEEEKSADDETGHNSEAVDYLAFEDGARIFASHSSAWSDSAWWEVVADDAWDVWNDVTSNVSVPTNDIVVDDPPMMAGMESKGSAGPGTVAKNLLDRYPDKHVVFGHTHVPAKGDRYVNSGAWTSRGGATLSGGSHPENTYVEIVDGDATVYDWSSSGSTVYID